MYIVCSIARSNYCLEMHYSKRQQIVRLYGNNWKVEMLNISSFSIEMRKIHSARKTRRLHFILCFYLYHVKGTKDWEFFLLRFWNLRYFFVSYVNWALIGGGTIFPRSPRTTRNEKNFELGKKKKIFSFSYGP